MRCVMAQFSLYALYTKPFSRSSAMALRFLYSILYTDNWIVLMGYLLSIDRLMQTSSSLCAKQNTVREAQTRNRWR